LNFELTEEQKLLQKSVREFAESEVKPLAKQLDETGHFPHGTFRKAAELGLTGVTIPEAEGGAGFDHVAYTIVIEEIARCGMATRKLSRNGVRGDENAANFAETTLPRSGLMTRNNFRLARHTRSGRQRPIR